MPLSDANPAMLWSRALAEELARSGVGHACVCPGNRSGPLAFALAAQPLKLWSHLDERSAGFFALGLAKAARAPVALLCTSGTAAANFLPAVVEAKHGRVPLVVLTADRPPDLRDTGANQAIAQARLYGEQVRWFFNLPMPRTDERSLRHLRTVVCRAVGEARGPPAGPVHLNAPFAKPLEPTPVPGSIPPDLGERAPLAAFGRAREPYARVEAARRAPEPDALRRLASVLQVERGLVVVGPQDRPEVVRAAAGFARATGWPLLADALSGLRFGPAHAVALGGYDAVLPSAAARERLAPQAVIRVGAAPTSDALLGFLEAAAPLQVHLDDDPGWRDPLHLPAERLLADPAMALEGLAGQVRRAAPGWTESWRCLDSLARDALARAPAFFEAHALAEVLERAPEGADLVVGNSLPIRDLDRFGAPAPKALRVLANRGASGIDGVTSTALGVAAAGAAPTLLVTGDVSFLHDLSGLVALKRHGLAPTIVVLHNDGGRIFEQLPAAAHEPAFGDLFVTPHGLDLQHAARLVGAGFSRADDAKGFREALANALDARAAHIVEARIEPGQALAARRAVDDEVARSVERALSR